MFCLPSASLPPERDLFSLCCKSVPVATQLQTQSYWTAFYFFGRVGGKKKVGEDTVNFLFILYLHRKKIQAYTRSYI